MAFKEHPAPDPPEEQQPEPADLEMLVLSDDYAREDLIGRSAYRDGLIRVIRSAKSSGSFTIGIFGSWGSGKTSLLRQIKSRLEEEFKKESQDLLTVWFNPWQFMAEEHLIIPFFHTLVAALERADKKQASNTSAVRTFLHKLANVPSALIYGMEAEFKVPLLLQAKLNAKHVLDHQKEAEERIDQEQSDQSQLLALEYQSIYYDLIEYLRQAGEDLEMLIVVFIDDLDRCLPEKAIEFLEGLKVLLDLPNFVFVLGAAREVIEQGIVQRHGESYGESESRARLEREYLDKIIQFPFNLPAADPEKIKENILRCSLEKIQGTDRFVDLIHEALGDNPRTLKRFINSVSFASYLAHQRFESQEELSLGLLIKISLIGYIFPALFRQLEKYPSHLLRLQSAVKEAVDPDDDDQTVERLPGQRQVSQTGLPIIDQWLTGEKLERLYPILRDRRDFSGPQFQDEESVNSYVRLLGRSLEAEFELKAPETQVPLTPLREEMRARLVEVPAGEIEVETEDSGSMTIQIEQPLLVDKYQMTQALYEKIVIENPSAFIGEDLPVDSVTWFEAVEFCNALSQELGLEPVYTFSDDEVEFDLTKNGYRLPTEAEWTYVFELGFPDGPAAEIERTAWYSVNSKRRTHGVGQKEPDSVDVFDMLGNVWEWCNDEYTGDFTPKPELGGATQGAPRVLCGGSWANFTSDFDKKPRLRREPMDRHNNQGFRVVRTRE